jgi:hypothetical protein
MNELGCLITISASLLNILLAVVTRNWVASLGWLVAAIGWWKYYGYL